MGEGILPGSVGGDVSNLPNAPTDDGLYFLKVVGGVASWQLTDTSDPLFRNAKAITLTIPADDEGNGPLVISRDGADPSVFATNTGIRPGGYILTNFFIAEAAFRLIDDGGTQHNAAMLNDTGTPAGVVYGETPVSGDWTNFMHGTSTEVEKAVRLISADGANAALLAVAPSSPSSAASMVVVSDGDGVAAADVNVLGDGNFFGGVHSLLGFSPASIQTIVSAAGPITVLPTATGTIAATGSFGPAQVAGIFDLTAFCTATPTGFAQIGENTLVDLQIFANANGGGDVLIGSVTVSAVDMSDGSGGDVRNTTELVNQTTFAVAAGDSVVFTLKAHNRGPVNTLNFADVRMAARFYPNPH